jgi:CRISPR-associated protein Csd1
MEIQAKLTADTTDSAYNCGRLLAVFDALQQSAHRAGNPGGRLNNTIAEKYFGSASGSPSSAFAILWRLHQHHLKKLRQSGKESAAASYRVQIAEISTRFQRKKADGAPFFPRTLTLMEQARFALGFYQQEAAHMEAIRKWKEEQGVKAGVELESKSENLA